MSVLYWELVDSCETCPGALKEHQKGKYRCKHDTEIIFQQNVDMGVPENCPKRMKPL
jgi:hypothetical protein